MRRELSDADTARAAHHPEPGAVQFARRAQHALVFRAGGLGALRGALLADAPLETARFLLARPVHTPSDAWRLLVYDEIELAETDYVQRSEITIELPPNIVAKVMERARAESATIVLTHSHPLADLVMPSATDLDSEAVLLPAIRRRIPGLPHARLIVGPRALNATLFAVDGDQHPLDLAEVGTELALISGSGRSHDGAGLAGCVGDRYDRQARAFGADGQRQLARLRVAIVGLGGTGSIVAQQLAHLGIGSFLLIDPDVIDQTSLNRVVGVRPGDIGRPKVEVARDMIVGIHPGAMQRCGCRSRSSDTPRACDESKAPRSASVWA